MARSAVVTKKAPRVRGIATKELDAVEKAALKSKELYEETTLADGIFLAVHYKRQYDLKSDGRHGAMFVRNLSDQDAAELINARELGPAHLAETIARLQDEVPLREHEAQG